MTQTINSSHSSVVAAMSFCSASMYAASLVFSAADARCQFRWMPAFQRWASALRTPDWVAKPEKIGMLRVRPTLVVKVSGSDGHSLPR